MYLYFSSAYNMSVIYNPYPSMHYGLAVMVFLITLIMSHYACNQVSPSEEIWDYKENDGS